MMLSLPQKVSCPLLCHLIAVILHIIATTDKVKKKKKKKVKRSAAAKRKRSARSYRRLQERNMAVESAYKRKLFIEIANTDGPTTEDDRIKVLQHIVMCLADCIEYAERPPPLKLSGVSLNGGTIWIKVEDLGSQERVMDFLSHPKGFSVRVHGPLRRYSMGVSGYLVEVAPNHMIKCLVHQNEGFLLGGLRYVSTHIRKDVTPPRPTVYVDVSKEAEEWLISHSYMMNTLTTAVGLWKV